MNRRTFLKLTGATAVLATTPLSFAGKKEIPQWIKLSDQLPDRDQKVVVCEVGSTTVSAWYGKVENNDIQLMGGNKYVPYSLIQYEYYELYLGGNKKHKSVRKYPRFYPMTGYSNLLSFYANESSGRYWLAVDGEFPKTIPPFPAYFSFLHSKWIAFEDQMPPRNEEIEVRDQEARTAKGWYVTSKTVDYPNSGTDDYFMPCEEDNKWLHISAIQINKSKWDWRYV